GFRQHDVRWFQVAVDDAGTVRFVEGVSDLHGDLERLVERERTFFQTALERVSLEIRHDEIRDALLVADVVQSADVWMIEGRDRPRLTLEAVAELRIGTEGGG